MSLPLQQKRELKNEFRELEYLDITLPSSEIEVNAELIHTRCLTSV